MMSRNYTEICDSVNRKSMTALKFARHCHANYRAFVSMDILDIVENIFRRRDGGGEMSKDMTFVRLTNGVPVCNIDCQHAESVQEYSPG